MSIVSLSDAHLGGGGAADDSYPEGLLWIFETARPFQPSDIVFDGDTFELWQFSLPDIVRTQAGIFSSLNVLLRELKPKPIIHVLRGNHDMDDEAVADAVRQMMPDVLIIAHGDQWNYQGWRFMHGHQWDAWCRNGFWQPIAHGLTYFAGILEHVGIHEQYINPIGWVSPAHDKNVSARGDIQKEVIKYAEEEKVRVCYGHTHEVDLARDGHVVNDGCCVDGKASYAVLWPDGVVTLVEKD